MRIKERERFSERMHQKSRKAFTDEITMLKATIESLQSPWISVDDYIRSNHHGLVVFYDSLEPNDLEVRRSDVGHSNKITPDLVYLLPPLPAPLIAEGE